MGLLGKKKERCDACNKPFEDHDELVDHMKRIHPPTKPCTKCSGLMQWGKTTYLVIWKFDLCVP